MHLVKGKKKRHLFEILGYVLFALGVIAFTLSPLGQHLNTASLDSLRLKDMPSDAVIVAIDDATLQELGAWPLSRTVYAELLKELDQYVINGVVFDVLFLEEKQGDDAVVSALEKLKYPVVFGVKQTDSGVLHSVYQGVTGAREAFANVVPDRDGKVRDYMGSVKDTTGCVNPLSLEFVNVELMGPRCFLDMEGRFVYPRTIPVFSLADIVKGRVPKEVLREKTLFVGATTLDLDDIFVGLEGTKIPGVFVHASMYASYKNNLVSIPLSNAVQVVLLFITMVAGIFGVIYLRKAWQQVVTVFTVSILIVVASVVAFDFSKELPMVSLLVSFLGSFVIAALLHYAMSRRENTFIKTMFSRYVNKDVLHKLLQSDSYHQESEKRYITLLFSDLRGFTDFSETLSPEDLTKLLNEYFSKMVTEIFKENGTVDKFIGDAVMAFWNAPLPTHHHELRAVRAAIGMQEALERFNQTEGTHLKMGIGVHAGDAVIGNVGGSERISYTALGDSVNTASRLEGVTKKYGAEIIISGIVRDSLGDDVDLKGRRIRKLDEVRLKGKQNSIMLFEITKASEDVIREYEKAFTLYQQKECSAALTLLKGNILANDTPSLLLVERIESGKIDDSFTGVWAFDEK